MYRNHGRALCIQYAIERSLQNKEQFLIKPGFDLAPPWRDRVVGAAAAADMCSCMQVQTWAFASGVTSQIVLRCW